MLAIWGLHPNGYKHTHITTATVKTCGKYVKEMRRRYGLTQEQLAAKAGVGLRFLRELEADKPTLRMDKVNTVLEMFGSELGVMPKNKTTEP